MTAPLHIEALAGRPFCFRVSSRSVPNGSHYVDWLHTPPSCTCNAYAYNNRRHTMETGKHYVCAHMAAAKEKCWDDMLEGVREQLLSQ